MPRIVRPDLFRIRGTEIGSPARSTTGRSIKRNKELREFLTGSSDSQVNQRFGTGKLTSAGRLIKLAANMDYSAHSIIWVLVIGLVIGAIAKLLMPGKDPGGCIVTILLGIAGAFVGTWIGRLVTGNETYTARWVMSVVGAMLLLLLYRLLFRRRP